MPRTLMLSVCLALLGCTPPAPPPPASYVLSDGTTVDVDARGGVTLRDEDGRTLLGTRGGPVIRSFASTVSGAFGGYTFRRTGEVLTRVDRYTGSRATAAGVEISFGGEGATATVEVSVDTEGVATRLRVTIGGPAPSSIEVPIACDAESSFLGFGAQYDRLDHRGERFPLFVTEQGIGRTTGGPIVGDAHTTYFPMPYWLDLRGFGALFESSARTLVDLCATDPQVASVEVEDGAPLSLVVLHGPTPLDVVDALGARLGRPPPLPSWAFDPWISVQGGQDAVVAESDALIAAGIPVGALWSQDWSGRREFVPGSFGVAYQWVSDPTLYPDLRGMTDLLHARGQRFLAYANPFVIPTLAHYDEMAAMGLLVSSADGAPYAIASLNGTSGLPDFTRPETYAYVERFLRDMVVEDGIDGWMVDFGEWLPLDASLHDGSDPRLAHSLYPTAWHRASRDALEAARPDGDWVTFSRSGWSGEQSVAQIVWIGDQEVDFSPTDGLPTVVPALLSLGLSAVPFATLDIGGFSGGPRTKEAFQRWTELAAFTPVFRTHEGLQRLDNWDWNSDAETILHFRRFALVHAALRPLFELLAADAVLRSRPILRPLSLVFPDDPGARGVADAFMLGDELLIAPVLEEGSVRRAVHLPPGPWFHVWTGAVMEGDVEVDAPIGAPPVFSRVDRPDLRAIE